MPHRVASFSEDNFLWLFRVFRQIFLDFPNRFFQFSQTLSENFLLRRFGNTFQELVISQLRSIFSDFSVFFKKWQPCHILTDKFLRTSSASRRPWARHRIDWRKKQKSKKIYTLQGLKTRIERKGTTCQVLKIIVKLWFKTMLPYEVIQKWLKMPPPRPQCTKSRKKGILFRVFLNMSVT